MNEWVKRPQVAENLGGKLPKHIAIIMDGNGRWAKARNLPRALGHRAGVEKLKEIIRFCSDIGIDALSLYAFSTENWQRSGEEVSALMNLLVEYMAKELNELHRNNVVITTMGDLSALPLNVQNAIYAAIEKTKNNTGLTVCFALNYGSRQEIVKAVQLIAQKSIAGEIEPRNIDMSTIMDGLYTSHLPDLDLIIRTSGEYRLSNFMLFQAAYSELCFTPTLWPDFDEKQLLMLLEEYANRNRRFGSA